MGDVRQASARVEKIFREKAEEKITDAYEKVHGEISPDDYKTFLKERSDQIDELQSELMYEAGYE